MRKCSHACIVHGEIKLTLPLTVEEATVVFGSAVQEDEFLEAQYAIGPSERAQTSPCAGDKGLLDPMTRRKFRPKKLLFTKFSGTIGLGRFSRLPGSSRKARKCKSSGAKRDGVGTSSIDGVTEGAISLDSITDSNI
ncbi:hypothetical protein Ancab_035328 [Ancistrocladus abbreviatus]